MLGAVLITIGVIAVIFGEITVGAVFVILGMGAMK
jgi:hypothetical protein